MLGDGCDLTQGEDALSVSGRLKKKVEALHGETKAYLDSMRAAIMGQERVAAGMTAFFDEGSKGARQARLFKDIVDMMATHSRHEFDENYRASVMEPVTRFGILFLECEELIRRREKRRLDYDSVKGKVRHCVDKPSRDVERLPKLESEEEKLRAVYEELNMMLVRDIPALIDMRLPYLGPSLVALIQLHGQWMTSATRQMSCIQSGDTDAPKRSVKAAEDALAKMKQLPMLHVKINTK